MPFRLAVTALFALALACGCTPREAERPAAPETHPPTLPPPTGFAARGEAAVPLREAPAFALPALGGDTLRLADFRGKVVVLNFWATWCPPCLAEIPDLNALHAALGDAGLTVAGVSLDEEGFEAVAPFAEDYAIAYPLLLDDGTVAAQFGGVYGLPTSFIIDRDGQVVNRIIGVFPVQQMWPLLLSLLGLPEGAPFPEALQAAPEAGA